MHITRFSRPCRLAMSATCLTLSVLLGARCGRAASYHVDAASEAAADTNPGSEAAPWKTISRAAGAEELKPGDTVWIHAGVYRESVAIGVSGQPGQPITFAAAPHARVVIKGSEIVRGKWTRLEDEAVDATAPGGDRQRIWKIGLGEEFFEDPRFTGGYRDKSRRWVSQVFVNDNRALQRIGPDPIYRNAEYLQLATVGRNREEMIEDSFFFDPADQTLYVKIAGEPGWFSIEVGVRAFTLTAENVHDLVIRGLECRHNRQPGGQWPMATIGQCQRVLVENCRFYQADFCGLGVGRSTDCTVRDCDLSYNGNTGLGMGECRNCLVEGCTLLANNYRRFHSGWHAGGMKCIPGNLRCTVRDCEAAWNVASDGIWFDYGNAEIRILGNVSHDNDGAGIFFEVNKGGGLIADNLVYANRGRGIYISGSQKTWVVHNTVAANESGIVAMSRGEDWPLEQVHVLNNLLLANYVTAETITRGSDLTLEVSPEPAARQAAGNRSDYNLYAANAWTPLLRHNWNDNNTLPQWQQRYQLDQHSKTATVPFRQSGAGFRLLDLQGLDVAGPLPEEVTRLWQPPSPARVGARRDRWPGP